MSELRVAVWGLGRHALTKIVPALAAAPAITLAGVYSRRPTVASDTATRYQCRSWTDPHAMLCAGDLDVVMVCTPIALHAQHGREVLLAGKHLWCEKPFAATYAEAAELVGMAKDRNLTVAEGFMYLYHPHFRRVHELVQQGELGTIQSFTCRFGIPPLTEPGFRTSALLGGGAFLDVGCYPVSAAVALFESATSEVVLADIEISAASEVDTAGFAMLRHDDVVSMLEWRTNVAYRNELEIWASDGSLDSDYIFSKRANQRACIRLRDRNGTQRCEMIDAADHFIRMIDEFRRLLVDSAAAESERRAIMRRAILMHKIREAANTQGRNNG